MALRVRVCVCSEHMVTTRRWPGQHFASKWATTHTRVMYVFTCVLWPFCSSINRPYVQVCVGLWCLCVIRTCSSSLVLIYPISHWGFCCLLIWQPSLTHKHTHTRLLPTPHTKLFVQMEKESSSNTILASSSFSSKTISRFVMFLNER